LPARASAKALCQSASCKDANPVSDPPDPCKELSNNEFSDSDGAIGLSRCKRLPLAACSEYNNICAVGEEDVTVLSFLMTGNKLIVVVFSIFQEDKKRKLSDFCSSMDAEQGLFAEGILLQDAITRQWCHVNLALGFLHHHRPSAMQMPLNTSGNL